jgi:hypothetical protein
VKRFKVLSFLAFVCLVYSGLAAQDAQLERDTRFSLPIDWSARHVIYTGGGSVADMMAVRSDPRFLHSWLAHSVLRSKLPLSTLTGSDPQNDSPEDLAVRDGNRFSEHSQVPSFRPIPPPAKNLRSHVDWAVSLGAKGGFAFGEYPAKWTYNIFNPPDCTNDFVVFTVTATPGVGSQANLIGLNNLYSGTNPAGICGATPKVLFSYAIGSAGSTLSPVVSQDGKKVMWIEGGTHAILHITTWVAGQGTNATTGAVAPGAGQDVAIDYTNTTHPGCTTSAATDGNADAFYDFAADAAYLSAANGRLYHMSNVFLGTPTVDFCIVVNGAAAASMVGPVYDRLHNKVYVTDGKTMFAYTVGASSFTAAGSIQFSSALSLSGPPVVDPVDGFVYVYTSSDTTGAFTTISQMPLSLASKTDVHIGPVFKNATAFTYSGDFDNNYYSFGPTNANATLYACGTDPAKNTAMALYTIGFQSTGTINTTPLMSANIKINPGEPNGVCSPLAEFYDGTHDRLFAGMGNITNTTGANVVQMWDITTRITSTSTGPTASATPYYGGSSSFAFDNISTQNQAQSFYFGSVATNTANVSCGNNDYCAVKLTQGALQ